MIESIIIAATFTSKLKNGHHIFEDVFKSLRRNLLITGKIAI